MFNAPKDKAEILSRQYRSVYTQEDQDSPVPEPEGVPYLCMKDFTVTEEGVEKLLHKSNTHKASGPDMILARFLKECSKDLAPLLATIFNKSLQTGTVPTDWKKANVSAVFKKGQCYDAANYRPVSLTFFMLQASGTCGCQQCDGACGPTQNTHRLPTWFPSKTEL